jgi:DNA-binding Lrp family transcriptional regulator
MDRKDQKILYELSKNSRMPITQLAKKVKISREVVEYRLNKLKNNGIKRFTTIIDLDSLGFNRINFYLSLKHHSVKFKEDFTKYIVSHDYISAISSNIGKYDFIFEIFFKNQEQLFRIIYEIEDFCEGKIKDYFMLNLPVKLKFFHNKLFGNIDNQSKKKTKTTLKLNKVDKKILKILNKNSRENLIEISNKTKLNPNAVGYRIKNLIKRNIVEGFTIFYDYNKLGFEIHDAQIKVNNIREYDKIESFLINHPNIFYYYKYNGNKEWDFDIGIISKDKIEFKKTIHDIKEFIGDIIEFKDIYLLDEILKEELPKGVFID